MKNLIACLIVSLAVAGAKGADMNYTVEHSTDGMTTIVTHHQSPERAKQIAERREALRKKLAAMTPEQREKWRAERKAKLTAARAANKDNPRRIVKRERLADGSVKYTRADGTAEVHKYPKMGTQK